MNVPSTQPLWEVKLAAYTSGSRAFSPVAMAMLCMAKTSSVSPQPMMNCWKRVNGANHGATAADMSTCGTYPKKMGNPRFMPVRMAEEEEASGSAMTVDSMVSDMMLLRRLMGAEG